MDLFEGMRIFAAVVETKSLTKAGQRLGLSPSTVSKSISNLEERFGVTLLDRTTRRLWITEVGENFHARCLQVLDDVARTEAEISELRVNPRGTLKVTAPPVFVMRHLATRLPTFLAEHPEIRLDLMLTSENVDLSEQGIDVAIRIASSVDPAFIAVPLAISHRAFCAAPSYLASNGTPTHPDQLVQHNCLVYNGLINNPWPYRDGERLAEVYVQGSFSATNLELVRQATLAGLGIALMPTWLVADDLRERRLQQVLTEFRITSYSVYALAPRKRYMPVKTKRFIAFLEEIFSPRPPWERG
jgi:DNA-binding transcriptional LysR family regulator